VLIFGTNTVQAAPNPWAVWRRHRRSPLAGRGHRTHDVHDAAMSYSYVSCQRPLTDGHPDAQFRLTPNSHATESWNAFMHVFWSSRSGSPVPRHGPR
jgi:hypothetical protein